MNEVLGTKENPRHILGISGGKDSSALAVLIKKTRPEIFAKLELFFTDTGADLPEIYEYIEKLEKYLGKPVLRIKAALTDELKNDFRVVVGEDGSVPFNDVLFKRFKGFLPAPNARWCTRELKIIPMEQWIGDDYCISYVGIRNDEPTRTGYTTKKNINITPVYPYKEDKIDINGVYKLLDESVGLPEYYKWRTRSGCFFCFYQRRVEFAIMYFLYPELFEEATKYETTHDDGRQFTWVKDKPLSYIEDHAKDIIKRYIKKQHKKASDEYKKGFVLSLDEMLEMIENEQIREFIDTWDLKRLHDVDGENKEGCNVCTI